MTKEETLGVGRMKRNKLNLGSGKDYRKDWVNVDIGEIALNEKIKIDVKWNLNKLPYPFEDNTFDEVLMSYVLEYLNEPIEVLKEISRICRKDAKITLFVVHAKSYSALSQINYKINFTENSFDYRRFEQYSIPQFELIEKEFIFKHWWKRFIPCKKYLIKFFDGLYDCMRFEFKVNKEINKN